LRSVAAHIEADLGEAAAASSERRHDWAEQRSCRSSGKSVDEK
jgi:hypothetical protein